MKEWVHTLDDSLWLIANDMPDEEAAFIRKALQLRKGMEVLDCPCGSGRTSLPLARAGMRVTGIDLRPQFIRKARRRFQKEGLDGDFHQGDMREVEFDSRFHAVINWFTSFGYFDDAGNQDVMNRFARALRPGGRFLIDVINRERVLRNFCERSYTEKVPGKKVNGALTQEAKWDAKKQRIDNVWTIHRKDGDHPFRLSIRVYTPGQMKRMFERGGLELEAAYGNWRGEAFAPRSSRRMVMVARKPK